MRHTSPPLPAQVMVGERFLVTCTNALPVLALESELLEPKERLGAYLEKRAHRKSGGAATQILNKLEQSVMDRYRDTDTLDAVRVKALLGHYLLHPFYLSTYQIKHVLELNNYVACAGYLIS